MPGETVAAGCLRVLPHAACFAWHGIAHCLEGPSGAQTDLATSGRGANCGVWQSLHTIEPIILFRPGSRVQAHFGCFTKTNVIVVVSDFVVAIAAVVAVGWLAAENLACNS